MSQRNPSPSTASTPRFTGPFLTFHLFLLCFIVSSWESNPWTFHLRMSLTLVINGVWASFRVCVDTDFHLKQNSALLLRSVLPLKPMKRRREGTRSRKADRSGCFQQKTSKIWEVFFLYFELISSMSSPSLKTKQQKTLKARLLPNRININFSEVWIRCIIYWVYSSSKSEISNSDACKTC